MTLTHLNPTVRRQVRRFIGLPFDLYRDCPQWCPPLRRDVALALDPERHPFYRHSTAESFLAEEGGRPVGRITVMENRRFNEIRRRCDAFFYFFETVDDPRVAAALIGAAADWARARGLDSLIGPKGLLPGDGLGILVEGFEHPAAMGVPYHHPYYDSLLAGCGLTKETDYLSGRLSKPYTFSPQMAEMGDAAAAALGYALHPFTSKRELRRWFGRIGEAYNRAFADNWEFCPLTPEEIKLIGDRLLALADPRMMVLLMQGDAIAGHLFIVPDLGDGLRRSRGRLLPLGWWHLLWAYRRTRGVDWFGMGLLPEHRGVGANAVMYTAIARAIDDFPYDHAELVQVEESNARMLRNMSAVGVPWQQRHRLYRLDL